MTQSPSATTAIGDANTQPNAVGEALTGTTKALFSPRIRVLILTGLIVVAVVAVLGTVTDGTTFNRSHALVLIGLTAAFALSERQPWPQRNGRVVAGT